MTANGSANPSNNTFASLLEALRTGTRFMARVALGGLAIIAAGIVALAMAGLGVLIAMAALIFRLTHRAPKAANKAPGDADGTVTLEARQTGQGWTVE